MRYRRITKLHVANSNGQAKFRSVDFVNIRQFSSSEPS